MTKKIEDKMTKSRLERFGDVDMADVTILTPSGRQRKVTADFKRRRGDMARRRQRRLSRIIHG